MSGIDDWRFVFPTADREIYERYRRRDDRPIDWESAALLIVDMTQAFLGPRLPTIEAVEQVRTACGLPAWSALTVTHGLLEKFRSSGRLVVFAMPSSTEKARLTCAANEIADRPDNRIPDEIAPARDEYVVMKSMASAFFGTALPTYCLRWGLRTVVIAGGTTSGCVRATAVDASSYGLRAVVVADACFDRSQLSHRVALFELDMKYATVLPAAGVERSLL